jgi:hypothetical protein
VVADLPGREVQHQNASRGDPVVVLQRLLPVPRRQVKLPGVDLQRQPRLLRHRREVALNRFGENSPHLLPIGVAA